MKPYFLSICFALISAVAFGGATIEFDNPPDTIRDGVKDSITVRFKVSGLTGTGPWTVSYIKLYEDDVFSDDLIKTVYSPVTIYTQNTWYYYTFSNIVFSNYEPANNGLELYAKISVGGYSDNTPVLNRTIGSNYAPTTPSSLSTLGKTDHEITVSWSPAVDPEGDVVQYRLEYGRDDVTGDGWTYAGTTTDTSYTISGLTADAPYIIRFTAKDEYGASGSSRDFGPISTYEYDPAYSPVINAVSISSSEMKLRHGFTVTADVTDQTTQVDLDRVTLYVENISKGTSHSSILTLSSMSSSSPSTYYRVVDVQKASIANGYRVTWTVCSQKSLADEGDLIGFKVKARDKEGNYSATIGSAQDVRFEMQSLPANKWTVISHGKANDEGNGPGPWDWSSGMSSWFSTQSSPGGWMYEIGAELKSQSKTDVQIHRVLHDKMVLETWNPSTSSYHLNSSNNFDSNVHHVLLFDWSNPSDFIDLLAGVSHKQDSWYAYAAGDALYALLNKIGAEDKINTLIGYSRGGVVSSEVSRRLLRAGAAPFQVLYLDAEGSDHYLDQYFHGWSGTRTDQYREVSPTEESWWLSIYVGANSLDEGNDRRFDDWPSGFDQSGRLDHGEWPEYFIESLYITDDPLVGTCLETPQFWKDDDGDHSLADIEYPIQPADEPDVDSEGLYNPDFDQYSLAGWCYHGGGGQNRLGNSVDDDGKADLCQYAPYITHNWSKLEDSLHYSFLKLYASPSSISSDVRLSLIWNSSYLGDEVHPSSGYHSFPVDFDTQQSGRLQARLTGATSSTHVDVDNFEFVTTDKPTIGYLSVGNNPMHLGEYTLLGANGLVDADGVKTMEVYHDADGDSVPELGELVATQSVGMNPSSSIGVYSVDYGIGDHTFYVRVADFNDVWSEFHSITLTVLPPLGDLDNDGLPDEWESKFFGGDTNAFTSADNDGDGYDNEAEYIIGSNPTNAASHLDVTITSAEEADSNSVYIVHWGSVTNRSYRVFGTEHLTNQFAPISSQMPYPANSYTDRQERASGAMYYKVDVKLAE